MVKEIKKYVTSSGREFDEEWKAKSYERVSEIVKKISNALGMGGSFTSYFRDIIEHRKELIIVLNEIGEFDERGIELYFEDLK